MTIHRLMKDDEGNPLTISFLQNMTEDEALHYFGMAYEDTQKINYRKLLHNLVFAAVNAGWKSTSVSDFWYEPVKTLILRLKHLFVQNCDPKDWQAIKKGAVHDELSKMVKGGYLLYEDLGIIDRVTLIEMLDTNLDKSQCWKDKIIFIEKDSAYEYISPIAKLLNASLLSGHGWSNTAAVEKITRRSDRNLKYVIYGIVDYDDYGHSILKEVASKFRKLGLNIVKVVNVGVHPNQIPEELIDVKKYPTKIILKSAVEWCEKYGLNGPYLEYWKTVKGVKTELIYAGTKCYGLEIQALTSIQPDGPQMFRDKILDEILKDLDEDDRIFELTEDAWTDMPYDATKYYVDDFTWRCFSSIDMPTSLDEYLTSEIYNMKKNRIAVNKKLALAPGEGRLEYIKDQITLNEELRDSAVSANESKYDGLVEGVTEEHITPLEDEIWDIERQYIHPIKRRINELKEEYISPLEEQRGYHENIIRNSYDQVISSHKAEKESVEETIEELEGEYDTERSILDEAFRKSRAIFGQAVYHWLREHKDEYYNRGLEDEECCMGVIRGFLKEACEKGKTAQDIIDTVKKWDKEGPYSYITDEMETYSMDEVMGHVSIYFEKCREKFEEEQQ